MNNIFNEAVSEHKKNNLKLAISLYKKVINQKPENIAQVKFLLGTAYLQSEDLNLAIQTLKESIKIDSRYWNSFSNLAVAYNKKQEYTNAKKYFELSLEIFPNNPDTINNLGNVFLNEKKFKSALECFTKAHSINNNPIFIINIIKCRIQLGDINEAKKLIHQVSNDKNLFPENLILEIELLIKEKLYKLAYSKCVSNLSKLKKNQTFLSIMAEILLKLDKIDELYKVASLLKDKYLNSFYLGSYHYKKSNLKDSLFYFKTASQIKPDNLSLLNNMALIYRDIGNLTNALNIFSNILNIDPNHTEANTNKALLLLQDKKFSEGWLHYAFREKFIPNEIKTLKMKEWDSDKLPNGPILVLKEQGIGDQFLFLNILQKINEPENFYFLVDERIFDFFCGQFPNFNFLVNLKLISNDIQHYSFIGDLQKYFFSSENEIKSLQNLFSFDNNVIYNNTRKLRCGLSWMSPKSNTLISSFKSIKLNDLLVNLDTDKFEFHNLQYGNFESEISNISDNIDFIFNKNYDYFNNLEGLIKLITELDVVITTSNIVAHLSGSVGKLTYLLVPKYRGRIWYWHDSIDSIWYKKTKVFFYTHSNLKSNIRKINSEIKSLFSLQDQ